MSLVTVAQELHREARSLGILGTGPSAAEFDELAPWAQAGWTQFAAVLEARLVLPESGSEEAAAPEEEVAMPAPDAADPWKHRSAGMRCRTCIFFVLKQPTDLNADPRLGRCRRHAPTMSGYPAVFGSDWCGDHKLGEEKL